MKGKFKGIYKIIAFLAFVVLICFIIMIPPVGKWVEEKAGVAAGSIRGIAATVAGVSLGIMIALIGVAALSVPIVGIVIIAIGLAILTYSLWPWIKGGGSSSSGYGQLEKITN